MIVPTRGGIAQIPRDGRCEGVASRYVAANGPTPTVRGVGPVALAALLFNIAARSTSARRFLSRAKLTRAELRVKLIDRNSTNVELSLRRVVREEGRRGCAVRYKSSLTLSALRVERTLVRRGVGRRAVYSESW